MTKINMGCCISHEYDLLKPTYIFTMDKRYRVSTILNECEKYNFTLDLRTFVDLGYLEENTILKFGYCCSGDACRHLLLLTPKIRICLNDESLEFYVSDWSTKNLEPVDVSERNSSKQLVDKNSI